MLQQLDIMPSTLSARQRPRSLDKTPDQWLRWILGAGIVVSILSFIYFFQQGITTDFYDAGARMLITRRVVDSPTPGLAQLGAVWLPLTHIAALPFIGIDWMYQTGIAGSLVSMASFVLSLYFVYRLSTLLTEKRAAGLVGVLVFVLNPNILYMQSTPMTELPMIAMAAGGCYYLTLATRNPDKRRWYLWSGVYLALGSLIRYENWIILFAAVPLLIYSFARRRFAWARLEGTLIYWGYWAFIGIAAWLAWNLLIFGDPLYFQRGEYADPSNWVFEGSQVVGNFPMALMTYIFAILSTVGPMLIAAIAGIVIYLARTRLRADSVMPFLPLALFPFFVLVVFVGQRPLDVPQITGGVYNIRFGLIMSLPVAVFAAYLASQHRFLIGAVGTAAVISAGVLVGTLGIITTEEARIQVNPDQVAAGEWFADHYHGEWMLLESFGNDIFQHTAGIRLSHVIYEGTYQTWELALAEPAQWAEWVVMRPAVGQGQPADKLWRTYHDDPGFHQDYELAYKNPGLEIYRRRPASQ